MDKGKLPQLKRAQLNRDNRGDDPRLHRKRFFACRIYLFDVDLYTATRHALSLLETSSID